MAPEPRPASARRVRSSLVASAREVEQLHEGVLEADDIGRRRMRAPPRLERVAMRHGGGYRTASLADYDWFYSLSRAEQSRLRSNWFSSSRDAMSPDEVAEKMPLRTWLDHTRRADAARALATGRHLARDRYGGLNPNALIAGTPYDAEAIHDRARARAHIHDAHRAGRLGEHHAAGAKGVEFFTDHEGIVHPIRATYEHREHRAESESSRRAREFASSEEF